MLRVWRNTRDSDPKAPSKKILLQLWENYTAEDLKTLKVVHPGGHVEDPKAPNRFSRRHLHVEPRHWRYFTVFEQAEAFVVGHDMDGVTDECLFYLGKFPQSVTRIQLEMSEATGEGVRHLQNLANLKALSLNFSRTIGDVALVHAGSIASLEYLDVNGCLRITGRGVAEWVVKYRGGGMHRFTVSFAGLRRLLGSEDALPNLKRLTLRRTLPRGVKPVVKAGPFSKAQKAELAKLRPGLEVR